MFHFFFENKVMMVENIIGPLTQILGESHTLNKLYTLGVMGVVNARRPWEHEGSRQGSRGLPRPVATLLPRLVYILSARGA